MKCNKKEILNQFIIVLAPFAPHVCEELWETLGNAGSVCDAKWPICNEEYLVEDTVNYTISFNGKARFNMEFPADAASDTIQTAVLADERSEKWMESKSIVKSNRSAEEDCEHRCQITDMQITKPTKAEVTKRE